MPRGPPAWDTRRAWWPPGGSPCPDRAAPNARDGGSHPRPRPCQHEPDGHAGRRLRRAHAAGPTDLTRLAAYARGMSTADTGRPIPRRHRFDRVARRPRRARPRRPRRRAAAARARRGAGSRAAGFGRGPVQLPRHRCRPGRARGGRDPLHGLGRRERGPAGRAPRLRRRGGGRRGGSRRLRLLLRRGSRRDVHARPRPRRHRGAPPRVRHGVDVPARQPLPRVHGPDGRGRRGHPRARRPTVGPRSSRTTTSPASPSRCCSTRRRTRARPTT